MTWEWEHGRQGGQWALSVGRWRAAVHRLPGARPRWQATLEDTLPPHERYTSPPFSEAVDARAWCLRMIAERRAAAGTTYS